MKNLFLAIVLLSLSCMRSYASESGDALNFIHDELMVQLRICDLIKYQRVDEARAMWSAMAKRLNSHSRYKAILLAEHPDKEHVLDIFLARWRTNMVEGTSITVGAVLGDRTLLDRRRRMFFRQYQLPLELVDVYYSPYEEGGKRFSSFLPLYLNIDGSCPNNTIIYNRGDFIGRNGQTDARRTEIAMYLLQNGDRIFGYFKSAFLARRYLVELYDSISNPANYLTVLSERELVLSQHIIQDGLIGNIEEVLPKNLDNLPSRGFDAEVVRVADGDTLVVRMGEAEITVRLEKIDAPEKGQPFWKEARNYLESLMCRGIVLYPTLIKRDGKLIMKKDRYGRVLATLATRWQRMNINLRMVSDGFAWHYSEYDSTYEFAEAERDARRFRLNIWSDPDPTRPSEWRKREVLSDLDNASTYGL